MSQLRILILALGLPLAGGVLAFAMEGVESPGTAQLRSLATRILSARTARPGIPGWLENSSPQGLELTCWSHPGNELFITVGQEMVVEAPVERVQRVLDEVESYPELFHGVEEVKVLARAPQRMTLDWEQDVPVFFIPNVRFQMLYEFALNPKRGQNLTRYQLKEKGALASSDGLIVLTALPGGRTHFAELDLFDAHWGIASILGRVTIWENAVKGLALSDYAVKLKAENPEWRPAQAKDKAEDHLDESEIDRRRIRGCLEKANALPF